MIGIILLVPPSNRFPVEDDEALAALILSISTGASSIPGAGCGVLGLFSITNSVNEVGALALAALIAAISTVSVSAASVAVEEDTNTWTAAAVPIKTSLRPMLSAFGGCFCCGCCDEGSGETRA